MLLILVGWAAVSNLDRYVDTKKPIIVGSFLYGREARISVPDKF